jgi:hypothetical protein
MVSRPELDLPELERELKRDASVYCRRLCYLNSPLFKFAPDSLWKSSRVLHATAILVEGRDMGPAGYGAI